MYSKTLLQFYFYYKIEIFLIELYEDKFKFKKMEEPVYDFDALIIEDEIDAAAAVYARAAIYDAMNSSKEKDAESDEEDVIPPKPDVPPGYTAVWSKLHSPDGKRRWLIKKKISVVGKKRKREEDIEDDEQEPKKKRQYIRRAAAPVAAPVAAPINKLLEVENKSLKDEIKKLTQRADELHRALMISIENSVKGR